ncbi:MAG: Polysaccharide biosynthesis protein [Candidatus Methanofastidiosum methylothiophilum]|uniref:Polysaccharide biosynthesis protein n=1 Tax=Candidatus Methanofastidiosum methylothiophilum TaxID=1705564 RepID=A0A150IR38_9EURY|nr:MAG: Polysaccharide biosynthesis protein [Candidatus Methanofastidiosum methylthiophilus]
MKKGMKTEWKDRRCISIKKHTLQTLQLFGTKMGAMALGFLAIVVATRVLGAQGYGDFRFVISYIALFTIFMRFGVGDSLEYLLGNNEKNELDQEYIGAGIVLGYLLGILLGGITVLSGLIIKGNLGNLLLLCSPLATFSILNIFIPRISVGTNKISRFSTNNIAYYGIFLAIILILPMDTLKMLYAYLGSVAFSSIAILLTFKPRFTNLKQNIIKVLGLTRSYGLHVYIGNALDQSTFKVDEMFITYFVGTLYLGYYAVAFMLVSPIVELSVAIANVRYKHFARNEEISKKLLRFNYIWMGISVVGIILFRGVLVDIFFGGEFEYSKLLMIPLAIGIFFQGLYQPYVTYYLSRGRGKYVRNRSIYSTIVDFSTNAILTPVYGAMGTAVATLLGRMANWIYFAYTYHIKKDHNSNSIEDLSGVK